MARFRIGTAIQRRYLILDPVGHGGDSIVYQALDTIAGRHVAVKALDPTFAGDEDAHRRIRREALITDRYATPGSPASTTTATHRWRTGLWSPTS